MPNEKIIQLSTTERDLYALTNQGRIFYDNRDGTWHEVDLPELNKTKPRAQAKESGYSDGFLEFWTIYPKGHGGSKKEAFKQYKARMKEGDPEFYDTYISMRNGAVEYARFIKATGQHVKHPATFLGRDKHYLNDYTIPDNVRKKAREKQPWEFIPEDDNKLIGFAKQHGFKIDGMKTPFDNRVKLRQQIKDRIELE